MRNPNGRAVTALLVTAALATVVARCGSQQPPSASPGATGTAGGSLGPVASDPWRPADILEPTAVDTGPSTPPVFCDPCHNLAENELFGVADAPGGLIAVGVQQPPAQAVAFTSSDGSRWVPLPGFAGAETTTAIAIATDGARSVIVGSQHIGATAWASNGGPWTQAPGQADLLVPYAAGAMTSVTAYDGGFVAGGYRDDPANATAAAAVWRSADGLAWRLDPVPAVFAGGRIWGIAATADAIVAVGTSGDPVYGPAAAWRWTTGAGWQRATLGPDGTGAMHAVAVAASGGFVAVGLNGHDDGARVWTSADGLAWSVVPDQPSLRYYGLSLRMQSILVGPVGLVVGGWRSDAGKGSAVTWTSADGVTWQGPTWETSFSGGEITGLAIRDGRTVAVGRTGYPDLNTAAIWTSAGP